MLSNNGKPWTKEQDDLLNKLYIEDKLDVKQIGIMFSRTSGGIASRLVKNKILTDKKLARGFEYDKENNNNNNNNNKMSLIVIDNKEYFSDNNYLYNIKKIPGEIVSKIGDNISKSAIDILNIINNIKSDKTLCIDIDSNELNIINQKAINNKFIKITNINNIINEIDYFIFVNFINLEKIDTFLKNISNQDLPITINDKLFLIIEYITVHIKEFGEIIFYEHNNIDVSLLLKNIFINFGYVITNELISSNYNYIKCIKKQKNNTKNYMVLDTETTGIPLTRNPKEIDKFNNARLIELGYIIFDKDNNKIKEFNSLIKPNQFIINNTHIHNITTDEATNNGNNLEYVLEILLKDLDLVDTIIGHNISFDICILLSECYRIKNNNLINNINLKNKICTMDMGKKFYKLDKNPKLIDLYKISTNKNIIQNHRAISDCLLCFECYYHMIKN